MWGEGVGCVRRWGVGCVECVGRGCRVIEYDGIWRVEG